MYLVCTSMNIVSTCKYLLVSTCRHAPACNIGSSRRPPICALASLIQSARRATNLSCSGHVRTRYLKPRNWAIESPPCCARALHSQCTPITYAGIGRACRSSRALLARPRLAS